jgi:hypothetical protein
MLLKKSLKVVLVKNNLSKKTTINPITKGNKRDKYTYLSFKIKVKSSVHKNNANKIIEVIIL